VERKRRGPAGHGEAQSEPRVREIAEIGANWNGTFLPEFKGTPLADLFPNTIEPFVAATRAALVASGDLPSA